MENGVTAGNDLISILIPKMQAFLDDCAPFEENSG